MNHIRPDIDEYFIRIASITALRSTCLRRRVGAVLVRDKQILTTGYNGAPVGLPHCADVGCVREDNGVPSGERHELCRSIHAEQNAIIQAALHGVSTSGSTLYSTHMPCSICAKMLINAGIVRVIYLYHYRDILAGELLLDAGVLLKQFALEA
jgi:dCMP deaminase